MDSRLKLILGSILAALLGLAVSSPILLANIGLTTKVPIRVEVAYAYFALQEFDTQVVGLTRNASEGWMISYFIVLNITNLSDRLVVMEDFEVAAAPEIVVQNGTQEIGSESLAQRSQASSNPPDSEMFSMGMENGIVYDVREVRWYPGWSQYWGPKSSRLIGLTGMIEISSMAYTALTQGTIYLYGKVDGRPYEKGVYSRGFDLKYVQLQRIDNEFFYNALVSQDQIIRATNGLDVYIQTRD
jgi:hypothetical protein